jgi:hypothetical protein
MEKQPDKPGKANSDPGKMKVFLKFDIYFLLFSLFIMLISMATTCQDDEPPEPPDPGVELIASATIGPEGGTVGAADVVLTIPAACFPASQLIEIYRSDSANPFGPYGASGKFYLKGLPDAYNAPLRLSLRATGTLQNQSFIVLGSLVDCHSPADSIEMENFYPGTDSAGWVNAILAAAADRQPSTPNYQGKWGRYASIVSSYITYTTTHFVIYHPFQYQNMNSIVELGNGLEGAYDTLTRWNFLNPRTAWPLEVTVKTLPAGTKGQGGRAFPYTVNSGIIEINESLLSDAEQTRTTGAHEYFHLVMGYYSESHTYDWLHDACATWLEAYFANSPATYVSSIRQGREGAPFEGLQAGATLNGGDEHGYGTSAVIKYVEGQHGTAAVRGTWEECANGLAPCDALKNKTAGYTTWWGAFLDEYFQGKIYSDMGPAWASINQIKSLATKDDTAFSFQRTYFDLSGYVFRISPEYSGYDEETSLELTVSGTGAGLYVYKRVNNVLTLLGSSRTSLLVPGLKDLAGEAAMLYALVYNDNTTPPGYEGTSVITLDGKVVKPDQPLYTRVHIDYQIWEEAEWVCPDTTYTVTAHGGFSSYDMTGSFTGTTFTGEYSDESRHETVTVSIDYQNMSISYLHFESVWYPGTHHESRYTLMCSGIPSTYGNDNFFWVNGVAANDVVTGYEASGEYFDCDITLTNWWFNEEHGYVTVVMFE